MSGQEYRVRLDPADARKVNRIITTAVYGDVTTLSNYERHVLRTVGEWIDAQANGENQ